MIRVNLLLLALLTLAAIAMVSAQHRARKLFVELEREQERARALEVEYTQLQLEQSTWAMHSRVEKLAAQRLRMRAPEAKRTQLVPAAPVSDAASTPASQEGRP